MRKRPLDILLIVGLVLTTPHSGSGLGLYILYLYESRPVKLKIRLIGSILYSRLRTNTAY
jgi:hypothetical protein